VDAVRARALAGICAGNIAAANAYIADVTTPENRARGMGMIGAAFGLGFIIGRRWRGGGGQRHRDRRPQDPRPHRLRAVAGRVSWVIVALKESLPAGLPARPRRGRIEALRDALGRKVLARLLAIFFLAILAFAGWRRPSRCGRWRNSAGARRRSLCLHLCRTALGGDASGLIGRLTARFGEERLLLTGLLLIAAGLMILPLAQGLAVLLAAVSFLALGMGAMQPSLNSLISRRAGAEEQGEVMGSRNRWRACRGCWGRCCRRAVRRVRTRQPVPLRHGAGCRRRLIGWRCRRSSPSPCREWRMRQSR